MSLGFGTSGPLGILKGITREGEGMSAVKWSSGLGKNRSNIQTKMSK